MEKASAKEVLNGHDDTKFVTPRGLRKFLLEAVYPVGSIYMSLTNVSPSDIFGGNWEQIASNISLPISNSVTIKASGTFQFQGGYGENIGVQTPGTVINKNGGTGTALLINNNDVTGTKINHPLNYYSGLSASISNKISGVNIWKRVS